MAYRMVAIDLDGTLLTDDKRVSEGNLAELRRVIAQGVHVIISTGRAWPGAKPFVRMLGLTLPVITSNGAMIVDSGSEEIMFKKDLSPEAAKIILEGGRARMTSQIIWSANRLYGLPLDERLADYGKRFGLMEPKPMPPIETLFDIGVSKILWYDAPEHIAAWVSEAQQGILFDKMPENVTICKSLPVYAEFFRGDVSKAKALEAVASMFGVPMEETIAIGDADNDLPMLTAAGTGVVMGNAEESVKAAADFVTRDNEHDGVAYALSQLIP